MSNKKQSSIDWLVEVLQENEYIFFDGKPHDYSLIELIEQAKEMHKEEIVKAMSVAFIDGAKIGAITYESPYIDWEQYYNETFNQY